jgi:hypothetical protein
MVKNIFIYIYMRKTVKRKNHKRSWRKTCKHKRDGVLGCRICCFKNTKTKKQFKKCKKYCMKF